MKSDADNFLHDTLPLEFSGGAEGPALEWQRQNSVDMLSAP